MWKIPGLPIKDGICQGEGFCGYCNFCRTGPYEVWSKRREKEGGHGTLWEWQKINYQGHFKQKLKDKKVRQEAEAQWAAEEVGEVKHRLWTISFKGWMDICGVQEYDYVQDRVDKVLELCREDKYGLGQSWAVVENYSSKRPDGGNLHMHILVIEHGSYKPSVQATKIAKHCGIEKNFVDYTQLKKSKNDFLCRINYMKGNKVGEGKMLDAMLDKEWRDEIGLRHIYVFADEKKYQAIEGLSEAFDIAKG